MANKEHLEALNLGQGFNAWRTENKIERLDFSGIRVADYCPESISGPYGTKKQFRHKFDFSNADFSGASFEGVRFDKHNCTDANFSGCNMHQFYSEQCNFERANFTGANCRQACFSGCSLKAARLGQADFYRAEMGNVDLEGVRDADTAKHLDTIKIQVNVAHFGLCDRKLAARWLS